MKHLSLIFMFTLFPLNHCVYFNLTGIEKAKFDIAKLLENQHLVKKRTKRQAKLNYPLRNLYNHSPNNPQFTQLKKNLNQIIPARIINPNFIPNTRDILSHLRNQKLNDVQLVMSLTLLVQKFTARWLGKLICFDLKLQYLYYLYNCASVDIRTESKQLK